MCFTLDSRRDGLASGRAWSWQVTGPLQSPRCSCVLRDRIESTQCCFRKSVRSPAAPGSPETRPHLSISPAWPSRPPSDTTSPINTEDTVTSRLVPGVLLSEPPSMSSAAWPRLQPVDTPGNTSLLCACYG